MGKNNLTRRQFVTKTVTVAAGAAVLGKSGLDFTKKLSSSDPVPLKTISLGKTGIKTTILGMGTGYNGYNHSSSIIRAGVADEVIRQAYEKGIRFFDCADSYGTHPYTASALKGIPRENYILSTKMQVNQGGKLQPDFQDADVLVERFRKELNTDYIDQVQFHILTNPQWEENLKKQMDILETLKAKKIIHAHGVSVHSLPALEACIGNPWVDVIHVRINAFGENMDNSDPSKVTPILEKLHKEGKGIIGMKLIGNGKFKNDSEKIDATLKFVLGLGTVNMVIVGFEQPQQIDNYIARINNTLKSI
jgi:aryl-alcohol dehydrogenase-like predicted oxidoreductase